MTLTFRISVILFAWMERAEWRVYMGRRSLCTMLIVLLLSTASAWEVFYASQPSAFHPESQANVPSPLRVA